MQNEELPFKLNEHGKLVEDDFEKDDKSFMNLDNRLNLQQTADQFASTSGRQQQRKSKKPTKALHLDNLSSIGTSSSSSSKKIRSQSNYISQQFHSPQSSSSSTSNSPAGSPTNLFQNSSLGLGNLTNTVNNSSLNSTNRTNLDHLNNLNNLNTSQSILPITFIQNALDNYKNSTILPSGSTGKNL